MPSATSPIQVPERPAAEGEGVGVGVGTGSGFAGPGVFLHPDMTPAASTIDSRRPESRLFIAILARAVRWPYGRTRKCGRERIACDWGGARAAIATRTASARTGRPRAG